MKVCFGKHRGAHVEWVLLNDPLYIRWVLSETPDSRCFAKLTEDIRRQIAHFDELPLVVTCERASCDEIATVGTLYCGHIVPQWWCGKCDPIACRMLRPKLIHVGSYLGMFPYVAMYRKGREEDLLRLIRVVAGAKGLLSRVET